MTERSTAIVKAPRKLRKSGTLSNLTNGKELDVVSERPTLPKARSIIQTKVNSGKYNLLHRKAVNYMIFEDFDNIEKNMVHEGKLEELRKLVTPSHKGYDRLIDILREIGSTVLQFDCLDAHGELEEWGIGPIMSISVDMRGDTKVIRREYAHWLRPELANPERWGRLQLRLVHQFNSKYGLALYENLETIANLDHAVLDIDVADLRSVLGVQEGRLGRYYDLAKYAINPAVKEVNEIADFSVDYSAIAKKGKMPTRLRFWVFKSEERYTKEEKAKLWKDREANPLALDFETLEQVRLIAPDHDVHLLREQWRNWVAKKGEPTTNPDKSFLGFVKARLKAPDGPNKAKERTARARARKGDGRQGNFNGLLK